MRIKFLNNKKGIIMHPYTWVAVSFIIGLLIMYFIAKGVIPLPSVLAWLKP